MRTTLEKIEKELLALELIRSYEQQHRIKQGRIRSPQRDQRIVKHRRRCMRIVREVLGLGWKAMGRVFNRHHASIMYHLQNKGFGNVQLRNL